MKIGDLPVPRTLVEWYQNKGITELYPPQEECVEAGLLEGQNLLVSIPTASGKTLVAEMAMQKHVAEGGKCLYIVPLKALAAEKSAEFRDKGADIGIAIGDLDRRDEYLGRRDIIIATSEKVDSLLRNNAAWLSEVSLLVADEVHLIDDTHRGPTLEMVLTRMRSLNPEMQVIGLSATIGNPEELAAWLDATLVTSEWRPVDLREGVFYKDAIHFSDGKREIAATTKKEDTNLCLDTIEEGGQCLVFVSSRRNAEGFAKRAAPALKVDDPELARYSARLEVMAETDMGKVLAACVAKGAAFHHAGLKRQQREIVEEGFRKGHIKVISSTPTLAAGINLPARRVIVRDWLRFEGGTGMVPIPVREYRQMAGRAGRPHLDPYGEAVMIAKRPEDLDGLSENYIDAPAEDVRSRLDDEGVLTSQILSLIATGFVHSEEELSEFMKKTFYLSQHSKSRYLKQITGNAIRFLSKAEMVSDLGIRLEATEYGTLVSRLYISPAGAEQITTALAAAEEFSEIGLLQLICGTPDMFTLFVKKDDLSVLEGFIYRHEDELWSEADFGAMEEFYRSLKTALLLEEWLSEKGEETICSRFGVGPGDIYSAVNGINWLLHAASRLSAMMAPEMKGPVHELELRMKHGIRSELLPLVRLRGIGRVRARRLFNNGITSPDEIKKAGMERLVPILGQKTAEKVMAEAGGTVHDSGDDDESAPTQATFATFGSE